MADGFTITEETTLHELYLTARDAGVPDGEVLTWAASQDDGGISDTESSRDA